MQSGANANYNLEVLREFRGKRYQESIDGNPKSAIASLKTVRTVC